ncbi:Fe-S cluster assembly protein SufB [Candidatus Dependentiae bacterium]|nr:Fe-S cluster assembly protein SufB [Candidatus Dependentiae bacterium]
MSWLILSNSGDIMDYHYKSKQGLNKQIVIDISERKNEPGWMTDFRLKALEIFESLPLPAWGPDLSELNIQDIYYYIKPLEDQKTSWDDVPDKIKNTFEALGIPQAERTMLAGVGAQFESEVVYKSLKKEWSSKGVIFCDMTNGLALYPELFKKYFASIIPAHDNKFAALNSAVWSGGSFVYVPEGVHIDMPLQAYFRINQSQMGQFERTLIIAEKNAKVHYIEGCSAPIYKKSSLHSAVVEISAHEGSQVVYTTIQNWASNIYNLVTKRGIAYKNARISWVDGNFGSKVTMKYPSVILKEPGAQGDILSIAVASEGQHQDSGGKIIHLAPDTHSTIISKSISKNSGRASYRGLLKVAKGATNVRSRVQCDALMLDDQSQSDTYPTMLIHESEVDVGHEASVSKISDEQLFYLTSRGITKAAASAMIVNGFIEPFIKTLPMEYAVELNRLINAEMEGSIG